jgi:hypothetical protein
MTLLDVTFPFSEYVKCQAGDSCEGVVIGQVTDTADAPVNLLDVSAFTTEGSSTTGSAVTDTEGKFSLAWHMVGLGPHTIDVCAGNSREGSDGCSLVTMAIDP